MEIGKAALGAVAALCVVVGAGGVYLLTGGNEPGTTAASVSLDPTAQTVEQSEAIVADGQEAPAPVAAPAAVVERQPAAPIRPATARRREFQRTAGPQAAAEPVENEPSFTRTDSQIAVAPALEPARPFEPEPERIPEPAAPQFVELIVPEDSVIGLQVESSLTSERARVEDEVIARVTRDVRVGDRVAIPAGARAHGEVTLVERGGRLRERARLGVRFTSVVLADGTRVPLETEAIYREGNAPGGESAAKIGGGAIGGAIIGGILGGARGAVIGGSVGAGAGSAAVLAGGRNPATLPTGTPVTVRLLKPTEVTVEK